jgi:hypothetical protein
LAATQRTRDVLGEGAFRALHLDLGRLVAVHRRLRLVKLRAHFLIEAVGVLADKVQNATVGREPRQLGAEHVEQLLRLRRRFRRNQAGERAIKLGGVCCHDQRQKHKPENTGEKKLINLFFLCWSQRKQKKKISYLNKANTNKKTAKR